MSIRFNDLLIKLGKLSLQQRGFPAFDYNKVYAYNDLQDGLIERKEVLELLPLIFRQVYKLVEDAYLGEPDYVIEQIVVVRAYGRHKLEELQADRMLLVL